MNRSQSERLTDVELMQFCLVNPELRVERDELGWLHINSVAVGLLFSSNLCEINGEIGI